MAAHGRPRQKTSFLKPICTEIRLFRNRHRSADAGINLHHQQRAIWVIALKYGLFFAGAVINLTLCYWATRVKHARPLLTPLFFAAPALLMTAITVPFMWYGGGAIGGLIGSGRQRIAFWVSLCVFALLSVNSTFRIYLAATALPHVTIGGGVTGNALMAVVFAAVGFLTCWRLRRHVRAKSRTTIS